jgi:hypothetical protein
MSTGSDDEGVMGEDTSEVCTPFIIEELALTAC